MDLRGMEDLNHLGEVVLAEDQALVAEEEAELDEVGAVENSVGKDPVPDTERELPCMNPSTMVPGVINMRMSLYHLGQIHQTETHLACSLPLDSETEVPQEVTR